MRALLFLPLESPHQVEIAEDWMALSSGGFVHIPNVASALLECSPSLIDVLATGPDFVVYTVFDYVGGQPNAAAMAAVARLTGHAFDLEDEDSILLGPVLIVSP